MALPLRPRPGHASIETRDRDKVRAGPAPAFARALSELGATLAIPLAVSAAVQTGETFEALVLVAALTALSCAVLVAANRLTVRPT